MKTSKMISEMAAKISTNNLLKIDNVMRILKLRKLRAIFLAEIFGRNTIDIL
jgi:hypothetical protein